MRPVLLVGLAFAALILITGGISLSSPESEFVRRAAVREVHVPFVGDFPIHWEEYEIRLRSRSPESLALLASGALALALVAVLAHQERSSVFRRAVSIAGVAYSAGVTMLVASRRDFRVAAPILLPLGLAVMALSLLLMRMLGIRGGVGSTTRRGPSRGPLRASTSYRSPAARPSSSRRGRHRRGGLRRFSAPL